MDQELLEGKKVLVVDDEPDVLETLEEILFMCDVETADSFDAAASMLEQDPFDIAVLDIMGVDGYRLLEIATDKGIIAVMLTAGALSPKDTIKSYKKGAASYIPKDNMADLPVYLMDILEAKEAGKHFWWRWRERFGSYYDKKFGAGWQEADREFWDKSVYWY
jgi:DNA-binding NtrC family response regulator